jgi:hypothetical protein
MKIETPDDPGSEDQPSGDGAAASALHVFWVAFVAAFIAASIPTFALGYWVKGQLGALEKVADEARTAREQATEAKDYAQDAGEGAGRAQRAAEGVLHAIARDRALTGDDPQGRASLYEILPIRAFEAIDKDGKLAEVAYSEYGGERWVFIPNTLMMEKISFLALGVSVTDELKDKNIRLVVTGAD